MTTNFLDIQKPFRVQVAEHLDAIQFIVVDLFCGAGGTTTGFANAKNQKGHPIALVVACVNHDYYAIRSHWENHPDIYHFEEDVRTLNLNPLKEIIAVYRKVYPKAKLILWASLECTNFSKAKGGQPRDADSRTLAEHLDRYIIALNPDYIQIENVVEFRSWGPLDEKGKPISMKSGKDWLRWRNLINSFGYRDEWRELNSANFGAYTSRNRLFGCFAKGGLPIIWPQPTHSKIATNENDLFGSGLKKWKAVKEVLDFDDEGASIFTRKKPLVESTLERIHAGLIKHVAGGEKAFIAKYFSGRPAGKVTSIDKPTGTLTTACNQSLVNLSFLTKYYGNGHNIASIEEPAGTITTKDRFAKVQCHWLDKQYSGKHNHQSVEVPARTIMTADKHVFVSVPFILNPSYGGHTTRVDKPGPVVIARQDKAPLYLVNYSQDPNVVIEIYEDDSEPMIKIKKFMALYGISDIKMRMLKEYELKLIQGFPMNYKLIGNQSQKKKSIGNSVVPMVVTAWVEALYKNATNEFIRKNKANRHF